MSLSLINFYRQFPSEKSCVDWMIEHRWNNEPVCPKCGNLGAYRFQNERNLLKCKACKKQFTVKVGTIFEDSAIPLQKWFLAIYLLTTLKKGISSIQLAQYCEVTQKTSWFMLQRICHAVDDSGLKLTKDVGLDESYFGGTKKGKRGRGAGGKTPVFGMVERDGDAKMEVIENVKRATLFPLIQKNIAQGSTVMTDELPSYNTVEKLGYIHKSVNHSAGQFVNDGATVNNVENLWKHFKASINAIYIHLSKKHLQRYCDLHTYRFNSRKKNDTEKFTEWFAKCDKRLTYKTLTA